MKMNIAVEDLGYQNINDTTNLNRWLSRVTDVLTLTMPASYFKVSNSRCTDPPSSGYELRSALNNLLLSKNVSAVLES